MDYVILAAGGNATAVVIENLPRDRAWYEEKGRELMRRTEPLGVEQAGFLNLDARHFEMSGGEFCGNAARSAAMIIAMCTGETKFDFTMSGYGGPVGASVDINGDKAAVTCSFPNLHAVAEPVNLPNGDEAVLVDLGGIVHVLVREPFVNDRAVYERRHREIIQSLGLGERAAVGVCWIEQAAHRGTMIHPVVWVRGIDSFFYETACGSGSIAAAVASGERDIIQPSGQDIRVFIDADGIHLSSQMENLNVE
jgi:diaminopimelate epimerase